MENNSHAAHFCKRLATAKEAEAQAQVVESVSQKLRKSLAFLPTALRTEAINNSSQTVRNAYTQRLRLNKDKLARTRKT